MKAEDANGNILDVKGVSRDGNTINVAVVRGEGDYIQLKAVSPDGVERSVKGVKFIRENVEMELAGVKVMAHLKAIPTIDVGDIDKQWALSANADAGQNTTIVAINKKGREYAVNAIMAGKHPYLMHVRGEASYDIHVKIVKKDEGLEVNGIDEYGRPYDIKAKAADGSLFDIVAGEQMGNVIPIYIIGSDGGKNPVRAISSGGHEFDVKGIKVLKSDIEGLIHGVDGYKKFYAHIKALAPSQANVK